MNSSRGRVECPIVKKIELSFDPIEHASFMKGDVIGLITLDLVLRFFACRVMDIAFVIHVGAMDLHYFPAGAASFRIPPHVTSYPEFPLHDAGPGDGHFFQIWGDMGAARKHATSPIPVAK